MSDPLVSIVIINYNCEKWIGAALRSCLAQTMADFEVVVVDDCSTDGSVESAKSIVGADERFRFVSVSVNVGPSAARNVGIHAARGRFLAFLDSDDQMLPGTLTRCLADFNRLALTYPSLVMLMYDAWIVSESGRRRGRYMPPAYAGVEKVCDVPNWTLPSAWFVLRDRCADFVPEYRVGEGAVFVERMRLRGVVAMIGSPNVEYRLRMSSATNLHGALEVRTVRAFSRTLQEGRLMDPILPDEVPVPTKREANAWTYGRTAKAAFVNSRYPYAVFCFFVACCMNFRSSMRRALRFLRIVK